MSVVCTIYSSKKRSELYVYLPKDDAIDDLPDEVKAYTGALTSVMTLLITEDKALARVSASDVIDAINKQGFFIQMPPAEQF